MRQKLLLILILFVSICASAVQARSVTIATVLDGPLAREFIDFAIIEREIKAIVGNEFEVSFPAHLQVNGDWTESGISQQLHNLLKNDSVDIIITMFETLAIAVIFGLAFATVITLLFVPVLYSLLYRVKWKY